MNTVRYMQRIRYAGDTQPDLVTLSTLQKTHLLHVPFENLDIHIGERIDLQRAYEKVVDHNRGGFCYELNYLFWQLLMHLGFDAHLVSARVFDKATRAFGPEYDHMAVVVHFDEAAYLADVGFGEFSFAPIPILPGQPHPDERGLFHLSWLEPDRYLVKKSDGEEQVPQYHFSLTPRKPEDFFEMCAWHQTHPSSHFTQKRLCSLATEKGRITVTGDILIIKEGEYTEEIPIQNEEDFNQILKTYFNIVL